MTRTDLLRLQPVRAGAALLLTLLTGSAGAAWADGCDALRWGLTAEQAAKFRLAAQSCQSPTAEGDSVAPCVTGSEQGPTVRPQAEQLQLYRSRTVPTVPVIDTSIETPPPLRFHRVPKESPGGPLIPSGSQQRALQMAADVDWVARRHDIDPLLMHAIAHVESRHNARAVSPAGARGVMQVMPATAKRFGVDSPQALHDSRTNLGVSAIYLKKLQERFGNDLSLVLAAYNAGEGAVEKYGRRIPPFAETRAYVRDVLARYDLLKQAAQRAASLRHAFLAAVPTK